MNWQERRTFSCGCGYVERDWFKGLPGFTRYVRICLEHQHYPKGCPIPLDKRQVILQDRNEEREGGDSSWCL